MKTACPSCGAEVEFRYDDSFVRVCDHCRAAVLRSDRGIESLGKVADLVPFDSPLKLFSEGKVGAVSFMLVGMAQIRHASGGVWQEWYAKLDSGRWGWLAEAQGRYYLTFEHPADLPPYETLSPGTQVQLVGGTFTVAELGTGTYVAASGELPYRLVPAQTFRFVDLSDGQGAFATIDYGDGPAALYVGQQVALADLGIRGGEDGPPRERRIASQRLACPNCNAPVDLRVPGEAQRVVCGYCNTLLDLSNGALAVLAKLESKAQPAIPLGTKGTFGDGELTVIGYVQRSASVDGNWWPFEEYLLHAPGVGFRWLVCSDGAWSYVQPIAPGAVEVRPSGPRYDGVKFRHFQWAPLRVDQVLGEFYWQVTAGETVQGDDYVAAPAMLSKETTGSEENWSLGTYLTPAQVQHAFGDQNLSLPRPQGVAPNQPDPWAKAATPMSFGFVALMFAAIVFSALATDTHVYEHDVPIGPAPAAAQPDSAEAASVFFSDPFPLAGGKNIEIALADYGLSNNWVYVAADLVHEASGSVVGVDATLEYYSGVEDGESWSEGSRGTSEVLGPQPAGSYVLRVEGQQGGQSNASVHVTVRQNVFRTRWLLWAFAILGVPALIVGLMSYSFEKRRWENSTTGSPPRTATALLVFMFIGLFVVIWKIITGLLEASSDD